MYVIAGIPALPMIIRASTGKFSPTSENTGSKIGSPGRTHGIHLAVFREWRVLEIVAFDNAFDTFLLPRSRKLPVTSNLLWPSL